jgi:hypothetical protein
MEAPYEGGQREMALHGCSKETFDLFLYWLDHSKHHEDLKYQPLRNYVGCRMEKLAKDQDIQIAMAVLWNFGEVYGIPGLQNGTMYSILRRMIGTPTTPQLLRLSTSGELRKDTELWKAVMK